MYNPKRTAAAAKSTAAKAKQAPSGAALPKKRLAKASAKAPAKRVARSSATKKVTVADRDSELRVSDSHNSSYQSGDSGPIGSRISEWSELPPKQARVDGDPNIPWPDDTSKAGRDLARLERNMCDVGHIAHEDTTYEMVDFVDNMLEGEEALQPLTSKRYQCHLPVGGKTRIVWFDFKDKSKKLDAWGRNNSFIGVHRPDTFLHLITACCLSPVKINKGRKDSDLTGPEWHYCLAQGKWMQPYETLFIRYNDLLDNWGENNTLENHHKEFYFHNLGAVVTRGVAPIVTCGSHWAGRSLYYPRGMVVKPKDDSPLVIRKQMQVFPEGQDPEIAGVSTIQKDTTTAASTKGHVKQIVDAIMDEKPDENGCIQIGPTNKVVPMTKAIAIAEDLLSRKEVAEREDLLNTTVVCPEAVTKASNIEKENKRLLQQAQAEQPLQLDNLAPCFRQEPPPTLTQLGDPPVAPSPRPSGANTPISYGRVSSNARMSQSPVSGFRSAHLSPKAYPQPSALQRQLCEAKDELKALKAKNAKVEAQLQEAHQEKTEALQALTQSEREKGVQAVELANTKSLLDGYRTSLRITSGLYKQSVIREGRETAELTAIKHMLLPGFCAVNKQHMLSVTSEDWQNAQQQSLAPAFLQSPTANLRFQNESFENPYQGNQGQ